MEKELIYHEYYLEETTYCKEMSSEIRETKYWKGTLFKNGKEIKKEATKEEYEEFKRKGQDISKEQKDYKYKGGLKNDKKKWTIFYD